MIHEPIQKSCREMGMQMTGVCDAVMKWMSQERRRKLNDEHDLKGSEEH